MTPDLFADHPQMAIPCSDPGPDIRVLRAFALRDETGLLAALDHILHTAALRCMETPGGFRMSVAMTNCGELGWVSDRQGYRYAPVDPSTGKPWPAMPAAFRQLAMAAAAEAGYPGFAPDACLVNRYEPGARMSLHQDRNERDFNQPIVSVSLGLPAVFQWGGAQRQDPPTRVPLAHGDVVVWGKTARLNYHGVLAVKPGWHPLLGGFRFNLTFRKAG